MVNYRRTFRLLTLILLLALIPQSKAWSQVTYHILTNEFSTRSASNKAQVDNGIYYKTNIRVEAIRCTSTSSTVGLPDEFKSPLLASNAYRYYKTATVTTNTKIYDNEHDSKIIDTAYDIYTGLGDEMVEGSTLASHGNPTDIYVTYDYNNATSPIDLTGTKVYNVKLGTDRFFCFNDKATRKNRPGAALISTVSGEALVSDVFIENKNGINNKKFLLYYQFKFEGSDPYNITVKTAYTGTDTYPEANNGLSAEGSVLKEFRDASIFVKMTATGSDKMWLASDAHKHWNNTATAECEYLEGFFRGGGSEMSPIFNGFALLPRSSGSSDLVLMASKMNMSSKIRNITVKQPNVSNQYAYLMSNGGTDPKMQFKAPKDAHAVQLFEIKNYTFKVKTPLSNTVLEATMKWSDYFKSELVTAHVPETLQRKYVTFTGAYAEKDVAGVKQADTSKPISTFEDAANYGGVIWLEYSTTMPFEALPAGGSYQDARWYTIRMNGSTDAKNIGSYNGSNFVTVTGSSSDLHQGENNAAAQFAFIGDPFELKIISRHASETASPSAANRYMGCTTGAAAGTTLTAMTGDSDISTWQIEPGAVSNPDYMVLRQFDTAGKFIGWSGGNITYSTTSSTIRVVELESKKYVYHIVDGSGNVAVKATVSQDVGVPLKYSNIPAIIRSPGIGNATLTFSSDAAGSSVITNAPYDVTASSNKDIYVRYSFGGSDPMSGALKNVAYFVMLNGEYIYWDSETNTIKSVKPENLPTSDNSQYQWTLGGNDPYAVTIYNNAATNHYVEIANWSTGTVSWSSTVPSSKYIVKLSSYTTATKNIYEVMAATGETADAGTAEGVTTIYYNMARLDASTVKMVNNSSSVSGSPTLRFELIPVASPTHNVTYHLLDKEYHDLLQVVARHAVDDIPHLPSDYLSPLVSNYYYWTTAAHNVTLSKIAAETNDVYVTYDTDPKYDLQSKKTMYLLKYALGTPFKAENGSDGLETEAVTPIYPYCNGDCNFFVYGQAQYDLQQEGAASTRTRWAWFLESALNDPYHVRICSRQTETYNEDEMRAYFITYQPEGYDKIVTTLTWPGISGVQGTEYMILGTPGNNRLVTSPVDKNKDNDYDDSGERVYHVVNSFEQYWKTYDTARRKVLKQDDKKYPANPNDPTKVPDTPYEVDDARYTSNRTYLTDEMGWHSYDKWAYAKRWNGYNSDGKTSKGWEETEHWFQTVHMGEGVFELVPVEINPVLILLDQHGWEIMRKPLPTDPDDPTKAAKYDAIRPYDSPMVEAYYFWTKASKRSGFHQYYNLSQLVTVDGEPYTSTSLTDLPPYETATNIKDAKGNHLDEYVTYIVKDEYAQSYNPSDKSGEPFMIQQGTHFASAASAEATDITKNDVPATGGMSQYIIDNVSQLTTSGNKKNELWYVKPNPDIDTEMGYTESLIASWKGKNPYELYQKNAKTASLITNADDVNDYGGFSFSNGFDPYNIQITSVAHNGRYFVTNAKGATLDEGEGSLIGRYSSDPTVQLGAKASAGDVPCSWYDSRALAITNTTFMAVMDAEGNMQLMPRFDHTRRVKDFSTLSLYDPEVAETETHTQLYRPLVYNYRIIDNTGHESLRYQSGGDLVPQIPDHFKSPLAKNFKYYKTLTSTGTNTYNLSTLADEITKSESFASQGLTSTTAAGNNVYVRYSYDEATDRDHILKGNWLTMQIAEKDAKYNDGIKKGESKPATIDGTTANRPWQWKFLETPQSTPDPYAVYLFNRSQSKGTKAISERFAVLSHSSGGYALAKAGGGDYTYQFLNGSGMNPSTAAVIAEDKDGENASGFTSTSCTFNGTDSQVLLTNEVVHTYTYKVFTNDKVFAIEANQEDGTAANNDYVPTLPDEIKSPMLNLDQFIYYEKDLSGEIADADTAGLALKHLYGIYDDNVYVRYAAYDPFKTTYFVPNEKGSEDGHVARGAESNDAPLQLHDNLYNIVWYNDNMMKNDGIAVKGESGKTELQTDAAYEWSFEGNDPYAIKIKSKGAESAESATPEANKTKKYYINSSAVLDVVANAQSFMLLPQSDYTYGVLAKTGDKTKKLTMPSDGSAASITESSPTKYIIFALSTYRVTYHLVIANIGQSPKVTFKARDNNDNLIDKEIDGTTKRNLTAYGIADVNVGHVSLGDILDVPPTMFRPNVYYDFYVDEIYDVTTSPSYSEELNSALTTQYQGRKLSDKAMIMDEQLLGKHVKINIVYSFNGDLETNAGDGFILSPETTKWYTIEANVDGTPWLAQFTNAWGFELKEGRGTHYTNDYLWAPVGDPYGFVMYNRYIYKNSGDSNSGEPTKVLTTDGFEVGKKLITGTENANSVYEMLEPVTENPGYFRFHPVANTGVPQYYLTWTTGDDDGDGILNVYLKLGTDATDLTYGLTEELVKPYYDRAGYVGGLTLPAKELYENVDKDGSLSASAKLMEKQKIVYNTANIVSFTQGYYRLHSPEDIAGVAVRYASGYTHKTELTGDGILTYGPIPMHFYERKGVNTNFEVLGSSRENKSDPLGFTQSFATQGEIPILAPEYDPASIFFFSHSEGDPSNLATVSTQGLYVKGSKGTGVAEGSSERSSVIMTDVPGQATKLFVMDIGGAILLIHDNYVTGGRANLKYLSFDQTEAEHIYDLKLTHNTHTDHAKWLMEPANAQGLTLRTHSGGDADTYSTTYYYTSFYAPFDLLLPDDTSSKTYKAYACDKGHSPWEPPADLHPQLMGVYNKTDKGCPAAYAADKYKNKFIPAGTPVLIAVTSTADTVRATIPTSSPSTVTIPHGSTLLGEYLEQKLDPISGTGSDKEVRDVYVLGLPYTSPMRKAVDYATTGDIEATAPRKAESGIGFYINANQNKELGPSNAQWTRNNLYVLANKAYYRAPAPPAPAPTRGIDFVPVVFDDDAEDNEFSTGVSGIKEDGNGEDRRGYDNRVYDLQGRCVATEEQVKDGTWRMNVKPGVYIMSGKKIIVK